jgi:hypothetical protein
VLTLAWSIAAAVALQSSPKTPPPDVRSLHPEVARADIEAIVRYLASDELLGRSTGTPEAERAAAYLAAVLAHCGVEPAGDDGTFLQPVPLHRSEATGTPELTLVASAGEKIQAVLGRDFDLNGPPIDAEGMKVILAKSAEEIPKAGAADAAIFVDEFEIDAKSWLERAGHPSGQGFGLWIRAGPKTEGKPRTVEPGSQGILDRDSSQGSSTPSVKIRGPLLDRLRRGEIQRLSVHAHVEIRKVRAFNVVGRIAGAGLPDKPELAKEAVVVSAHYDHLPPKPPPKPPEKPGDLIFNGADDDASGCAAVLEIAGSLGAGPKPARTVIFLLATGEEEGLLGTYVYLDHPAVPLDQTVANLNVEMIGRPDPLIGGSGQVWLTGFDETDLGKSLEEAGLPIRPDPRLDQHFYGRSDNYAFVQRHVVGQTFSTYNMHDDYHRTSDEADRLDYAHMEACTSAILKAVRLVVDGKLRPAWTKTR